MGILPEVDKDRIERYSKEDPSDGLEPLKWFFITGVLIFILLAIWGLTKK